MPDTAKPVHEPFMADVHRLIVQHGVDEARRQAASRHERAVVEAAYQVLSEEEDRLGFTYSGFDLTSPKRTEYGSGRAIT